MNFLPILASLISTYISHYFSSEEEKAKAKADVVTALNTPPSEELLKAQLAGLQQQKLISDNNVLINQERVMLANASGLNWLQRNWLPLFMVVFLCIITYDFLLYPILHYFFPSLSMLATPNQMWSIIEIVTGVHITGSCVNTIHQNQLNFNKEKYYATLRQYMGKLDEHQVQANEEALKNAGLDEEEPSNLKDTPSSIGQ